MVQTAGVTVSHLTKEGDVRSGRVWRVCVPDDVCTVPSCLGHSCFLDLFQAPLKLRNRETFYIVYNFRPSRQKNNIFVACLNSFAASYIFLHLSNVDFTVSVNCDSDQTWTMFFPVSEEGT